jgi:hypothetical protein
MVFAVGEMSPGRPRRPLDDRVWRSISRFASTVGTTFYDERRRRRRTLRDVGLDAGLSASVVHDAEAGRPVSIESMFRIADALGMRVEPSLTPIRGRAHERSTGDVVHSAMAEAEARHLSAVGFRIAIDEPYQHYQFAGRADLLAWDVAEAALLHVENRTRFPNLGEAIGSFNAKRAYLAGAFGPRVRVRHWRTVTHVIVGLWSAEVLHTLRLREKTFRAVCPDGPDAFAAWWRGDPATGSGVSSGLVVFDPLPGQRSSRRRFVGLDDVAHVRPRYVDYADAALRLRAQAT